MEALFPLTLQGRRVRLEPLAREHLGGLLKAATESRETYALTGVPADEASMSEYIERARTLAARGEAVPFATRNLDNAQIVGTTRFGNIERFVWPAEPVKPVPRGPDAAEIGWTWLAQSAQRTHVNTEAKLLMLTHAFDVWGVHRVNIRTDARNARSRANIERVGGKLDGILRAHMPAYDGGLRDTASYSILRPEWPAIRERLSERLERASEPELQLR